MRTSPIAALFHNDFDRRIQHTIELCEVTHVDPRCVTSCVAANTAIYHMIHGEKDLNQLRALAFAEARKIYNDPGLIQAIQANDFRAFDLDDHGELRAIGHTYKC